MTDRDDSNRIHEPAGAAAPRGPQATRPGEQATRLGEIDNPIASPGKGRRPPWLMALPFLALLALAAAWSAAWFHLAGRAEAELERRLAAEAAAGHRFDCAGRAVSGFPFRFEVICDRPVLTLAAPELTLSAERLHAAMQIYDPSLVIIETAGPVTIRPAGGPSFSAEFRLAQASYRGTPKALTRAALVLDDVSLNEISDGKTAGIVPGGAAEIAGVVSAAGAANAVAATSGASGGNAGSPLFSAKRLEFHLRPTPDAPPGTRDFDFTAEATGLAVPNLPPGRLNLQATAFSLPDHMARNAPELLRGWQANGGRLGISLLRVESDRFLARASGSLGLDTAGRPEGRITADVAGLDRLASMSGSWGVWGSLAPALRFAGEPTKVEDRSGVSLELNAEHGVVRLGPVRLPTLPPVY